MNWASCIYRLYNNSLSLASSMFYLCHSVCQTGICQFQAFLSLNETHHLRSAPSQNIDEQWGVVEQLVQSSQKAHKAHVRYLVPSVKLWFEETDMHKVKSTCSKIHTAKNCSNDRFHYQHQVLQFILLLLKQRIKCYIESTGQYHMKRGITIIQ